MTSRATKIDTKEGDLSDLEVGGLNLEADDAAPKGVGTVKAVAACLLYMFIGPILVKVNNSILNDIGFAFPMAVASLGLISTSIFSHAIVLSKCSKFVELEHTETVTTRFYLTRVVPVGVTMALTLALGNTVYLHLGVALIQMLKAFTPVIVMLGLMLSNIEFPTHPVAMAVVGISIGTAINCAGGSSYTTLGLMIMLGSEVFEAVRLVLTQFLLTNLKFSIIEGQYWLAPASAISLVAFSAFLEWPTILRENKLAVVSEHMHLFVASALMGLLVNYVSFLVVQTTSSITLKILNTLRNVGFVMFQVIFAGEIITQQQFVGYGVTLVAFGFYNYFKMLPKPAPEVSPE